MLGAAYLAWLMPFHHGPLMSAMVSRDTGCMDAVQYGPSLARTRARERAHTHVPVDNGIYMAYPLSSLACGAAGPPHIPGFPAGYCFASPVPEFMPACLRLCSACDPVGPGMTHVGKSPHARFKTGLFF